MVARLGNWSSGKKKPGDSCELQLFLISYPTRLPGPAARPVVEESRSTSSRLGCVLYLVYTFLCSRVYVETSLTALLSLRARSLSAAAAFGQLNSFTPFVHSLSREKNSLLQFAETTLQTTVISLRFSASAPMLCDFWDTNRSRSIARNIADHRWVVSPSWKIFLFRDKFFADGWYVLFARCSRFRAIENHGKPDHEIIRCDNR